MSVRATVLGMAVLLAVLACGNREDASSPSGEVSPPNADVGQFELWKLELMLADRASNSAVQTSGPSSWSTFFAPDGSMIRPGVGEIRGREAVHEAFMADVYSDALAGLAWNPARAEVSANGELGYTVGEYRESKTDTTGVRTFVEGIYVRIWTRQPDGEWRVDLDIRTPVTAEPGAISGGGSGGRDR